MPKTHKLSHGPPRKTSMILYTCHLYNTFPFLHTSMNLCTCHLYNTFPFLHTSMNLCTCHLYNTFPFLHTSMILCTCHLYNRPFNRTFLSPAASPTFIVPLRFFYAHPLGVRARGFGRKIWPPPSLHMFISTFQTLYPFIVNLFLLWILCDVL